MANFKKRLDKCLKKESISVERLKRILSQYVKPEKPRDKIEQVRNEIDRSAAIRLIKAIDPTS